MISTKNNFSKPLVINIFGSCVTRDMLEYDRNNFRVGEYIARESIVSFLSNPISFKEKDIQLTSVFQRKQLIQDLEKSGLAQFRSNPGNLLIIDFIEERFDIGRIQGSYITISNEFIQSRIYSSKSYRKYNKKIWHNQVYFRLQNIKKYIRYFAQSLLSIYDQKQIIIHEVYMADQYIDETGCICSFTENYLFYNKKINQILEYMYYYLKIELPDAHIISLGNNYVADKTHKWGLAPMHFQKEYYESSLDALLSEISKF